MKEKVPFTRKVFLSCFRDSKGGHSFASSSSSSRTSSEVEPSGSESFAEIHHTSKLTAVNEDIQ